MNEFSVTTELGQKEYLKIMIIGMYRKPGFILATLTGIYLVSTVVLDYFQVIHFYNETPYYEAICGSFVLFGPLLIVLLAARQYKSNPCFQGAITYTFNEEGFRSEGVNFKGEYNWQYIIKYKVVSNILILYNSTRTGFFIDKDKLTSEQFEFIKMKLSKK